MAIALPPPSQPVLSTVEVVQAGGSEIVTLAWKTDQIHVIGAELIDKARIEQAINTATDLSDVVRQIQAAYYIAGYPAVQVRYARAEPDLFVLVMPGKLSRVEVPEPYTPYFAKLEGADPLTDDQFERARTLASIHSERKAEDASIEFLPEEAGTALVLKGGQNKRSSSSLGAEFGNPGNRFSGRHLLNYFAETSFGTGDELRFEGRHAMVGLNDDDSPSTLYNEHTASWSRVTTLGLFGAKGRYVGYQQEFDIDLGLGIGDVTRFSGSIRQGELAWVFPLHADFNSRWNLNSKLDYTRKRYEITRLDEPVQRQEYGSVEIGTDYARVLMWGEQRVDLIASVAVRSGMGDDKTDVPITAADLGYLLIRPSASVTLPLGEHITAGLGLTAQITEDTLPEQQQWVMGGVGNVEAFLPGISAGDSGGLARLFAGTNTELFGFTIAPQLFVEYGYTKLENPFEAPFVPVSQSGETQSVADAGISVSARLNRLTEVRFSYAESFDESKVSDQAQDATDANMFFSIAISVP